MGGLKRIAGLGATWMAASFSGYVGVMVYAFTFGPEASVYGVGFVALTLLLDVVAAWTLGFGARRQGFWARYGISLAASFVGATRIYAAIWRGLWPLFDT